jgi:transposase
MTSKILAVTDALGNLIDFRLLPGQAHDLHGTASLIEGLSCGHLLADRAFDANWLRDALSAAKIKAVIPPKSNRLFPADPLCQGSCPLVYFSSISQVGGIGR